MKKGISAVLIAVLSASSLVPVMAQKSPRGLVSKKERQQQQPAFAAPRSTQFAAIHAYSDGNGALLRWQMEAEVGNIGFQVYALGKNGPELLNEAKLVRGSAMHAREVPAYGESYSFFDPNGTVDSIYYVEAIQLDGQRLRTGTLAPIEIPSLRTVTGGVSPELSATTATDTVRLERSQPTMTKEIADEMIESLAEPNPDVHKAVISQPGVARISTKGDGLVRVPRAQLQSAGFDVDSDSSLWQLYFQGVEQSIIVGNNADYIEFFAKSLDTPESEFRVYYLMKGSTSGRRMETRVAQPSTGTVITPNYLQTFIKKERTNFLEDIYNGDEENYFGRGFGATLSSLNFNLTGVDFASPNAALHLSFQGYSFGAHVVGVVINDQVLPSTAGGNGENHFTADYPIPTSYLREGANTIKFQAIGSAGDFIFFDTMSIDFARKFVAEQNRIPFYTQNSRKAKLEGFSSANVRVFDMTYDGEPALMTNLTFASDGTSFGTEMPAARGRAFYAVEASGVLAPHSVTANNPELVGAPTNGAQLVIISHQDFMTQANQWATYRNGQSTTTKVIEVTELYDEFNYGVFSSEAIRSFLQTAVAQWQTPPQYVLLMGDGSYDSRNYENQGYWNMVPAKMVGAVYSETASDEALADFDDDGLAEISIGRIASRNAAGITNVYNKVVHWENSITPPMNRGVIFAYDHNVGYDFDGMSNRIRAQLPGSMPVTMIYRGAPNANATLINEMNLGKWVINYSGHGTSGSWGGNPVFFNIFSVPTLADNPDAPAIYTMLTCLNGAFHYLHNESFAEVLTKVQNRGAVAAWASTGQTTPDIQEVMATRFFNQLAAGNLTRLGDLIKDAKTVIIGGTDVRRSWALIGDPMLKVRAPAAPLVEGKGRQSR